jgi:hypothetical protein
MLRLVNEEFGDIDFYFSKDDNEYDICLRCENDYYNLYLNCHETIHKYNYDITVFIEPLNEILNLLPYIDSFNEYLDIYITDGFNEHCDLIEYLSLEKQNLEFDIFGSDVYLIKKGKVKQLND